MQKTDGSNEKFKEVKWKTLVTNPKMAHTAEKPVEKELCNRNYWYEYNRCQ